jgi:hypothetical protein
MDVQTSGQRLKQRTSGIADVDGLMHRLYTLCTSVPRTAKT